MTTDELRETVLAALAEAVPDADLAAIRPDASFRDQTEMDSVDFLNFVLALETRLGRRIPDYDYPRLSSLRGCLDYLGEPAPPG